MSACTCSRVLKRPPVWRLCPACVWWDWWTAAGWSRSASLQGWSSSDVLSETTSTGALTHAESRPNHLYTHVPREKPSPSAHTNTFKQKKKISFYSTQSLFSTRIKVTIHWRTAFQPYTSIVRMQSFVNSVKTLRGHIPHFFLPQNSTHNVSKGFLCQKQP